ncbi:MAG: hypothetical protein AAF235_03515, partial [Planctomycetota bacterium]
MARTPGKDPFAPPEPVDNPPPTDDPGGGDGSAPAPPPNPDPSPDPDDPTSSRRAHRSRAADGDASLAPTDPGRVIELELRLAELERALNDSNEQLEQANRRYEIDLLLSGAGVVDIETARVMTENLISDMQVDDVAEAIEALRATWRRVDFQPLEDREAPQAHLFPACEDRAAPHRSAPNRIP